MEKSTSKENKWICVCCGVQIPDNSHPCNCTECPRPLAPLGKEQDGHPMIYLSNEQLLRCYTVTNGGMQEEYKKAILLRMSPYYHRIEG